MRQRQCQAPQNGGRDCTHLPGGALQTGGCWVLWGSEGVPVGWVSMGQVGSTERVGASGMGGCWVVFHGMGGVPVVWVGPGEMCGCQWDGCQWDGWIQSMEWVSVG